MTRRLLALTALVLGACTSTHELASGPSVLGGGVFHEEVSPGLHYIVVRSNVAPWRNQDAVDQQWRREANHLCGGAHEDLHMESRVDEEMPPMQAFFIRLPYLVTSTKGYALCATSGLSHESALRVIEALP